MRQRSGSSRLVSSRLGSRETPTADENRRTPPVPMCLKYVARRSVEALRCEMSTPMSRLQKELDVACIAVQHCAVLTKDIQRNSVGQDGQMAKSDCSPVTVGDFASQALLTAAIHGQFKHDQFMGEESADQLRQNASLLEHIWQLSENAKPTFSASGLATPTSPSDLLDFIDRGGKNERSTAGRMWVFDPIDGTATFLQGQQYAINCAFLVHGREEMGIIGCPNVLASSHTITEQDIDTEGLGVMIFAVRGEGTWTRPMRRDGQLAPATRLERHGDFAQRDGLIWSDCSSYTSTILPLHQQVAAKLNTPWPGVDLFSSLMKYASLALGRSHIVIRIFRYNSWRSNMWDHAGGVLIYEEAGGKVTDLEGKPIDFTTGRKMAESKQCVGVWRLAREADRVQTAALYVRRLACTLTYSAWYSKSSETMSRPMVQSRGRSDGRAYAQIVLTEMTAQSHRKKCSIIENQTKGVYTRSRSSRPLRWHAKNICFLGR